VAVRRGEAVAALAAAVALIISGLVWLAGPWGLIGSGVALAVAVLFVDVDDVEGERGAEAVAGPARPPVVRR
jgi:hypothetical protein